MIVKRSNLLICVVVGAFLTIVTLYFSTSHVVTSYSETNFKGSHYTKTVLQSQKTRVLPTSLLETYPTSILILSSVAGADAYGTDRSFSSFLSTLESLYSDKPYQVSLGLLVKTQSELDVISRLLKQKIHEDGPNKLHRITLVAAPIVELDNIPNNEDRHADSFQRARRRSIARARNFLLTSALQEEEYTLFVDADIENFKNPGELLPAFIDSQLDIVVPRITKGTDKDYDKNSWSGERTKPTEDQLEKMDANKWDSVDYVPRDVVKNMFHFEDYLKDRESYSQHKNELAYTVSLDSVGGAVLFAQSIIYKQGVVFPTSYIVGTTWERMEGYDGIETEGLCYLAKGLGYKCWGMPNMVAYHSNR